MTVSRVDEFRDDKCAPAPPRTYPRHRTHEQHQRRRFGHKLADLHQECAFVFDFRVIAFDGQYARREPRSDKSSFAHDIANDRSTAKQLTGEADVT